MLSSVNFQPEKIGDVPMQIEAVLAAPSCIRCAVMSTLKIVRAALLRADYIWHNVLHLIDNQGCALERAGYQSANVELQRAYVPSISWRIRSIAI